MPKVVLAVACEKPIIGADNTLSLITVLHSIKVFPAGKDPSGNALMTNWHVVTLWRREPMESGSTRFQQRLTITNPEGKTTFQALTEFEIPRWFHRNINRIQGFPAQDGDYNINIAVRDMKQESWTEGASFPLRIEVHKPVTAPSTPTTH